MRTSQYSQRRTSEFSRYIKVRIIHLMLNKLFGCELSPFLLCLTSLTCSFAIHLLVPDHSAT
ncbi:hypothetical protein ACVW06_000018 [Pantoea ananatis]